LIKQPWQSVGLPTFKAHRSIFVPGLLLMSVLICGGGSLFAQDVPLSVGPPLKVAVNRVNVGVTVTDGEGRFVHDLNRDEFQVYDDGVEQSIVEFLPVEEPAQVLLLIESGPSVLFFAKNHVLAADQMVASLAPDDRVAIATYTKGLESVIDFTTDKAQARMALNGIDFALGFGELNLFASVSRAVDVLSTYAGKKTIVLLSTGVDTSPDMNWEALCPKLQTADARIIAVSLSADIREPAKRKHLTAKDRADRAQLQAGFAEGDKALRELGQATGGRVYFVQGEKEFAKAYAEIADLLRHEYNLFFAPPHLDEEVHQLRVEVKRPDTHVEHRPAYLAVAAR
jgi:VWFA-related protein